MNTNKNNVRMILMPTEDFENLNYKADPEALPPREIPPYNGFGSEEDSLATCLSLRPKPTRRDFKKFMEKDRCVWKGLGQNQTILNFSSFFVVVAYTCRSFCT